jgi:proline iminopeptidase
MAVTHAPGRHVEVRGHRLWVEIYGDGPPLLLLAGLGPAGSHVIFHPFFTGLARTHRASTSTCTGADGQTRPPT